MVLPDFYGKYTILNVVFNLSSEHTNIEMP